MTSPLIVDVYAGDLNGKPNWSALAKLGAPWHGAIIKATEGVTYNPPWFAINWRAVRDAGRDRYGVDWFRGAYHFLKFNVDGRTQADLYVKAIEAAGGFAIGDFWPIVDVELGGETNSNQRATREQIIECTTKFAQRAEQLTGRKVMLYGNGAMRDRQIKDRMGCSYLWCPRYTQTLPSEIYTRAGWSLDELIMWQYNGDGVGQLIGYPQEVPNFGKTDISVIVKEGGLAWLRSHLWAEDPTPPLAA